MSVDAATLRERCRADWEAAVDHRFVRELADGTIDDAVFARYLLQDYAFVADLTGLVGHAAGQAPTLDARVELADFLRVLGTDEDEYFTRAFDALGVPEGDRTDPAMHPTTRAFRDLLGRAAREGGYAESLAVLLPVEWVYAEWADAVEPPEAFYLAEWVELHDTSEFRAFVNWLREEFDVACADVSARRADRVAALFERAVKLEVDFFAAAYEG